MKRRLFPLMSLLLIFSFVLAACGGASPAPATAPAGPPATTPQAAEPTTAPVTAVEPTSPPEEQLRRLVVAQGSGVENWDPPVGWITASEWIEMNVYDCLVFADRETGEIIGWLAESYENTGPTTWRLKLREGVTFHNGYPFTAEDAKFSIDRIINGTREQFIVFDQWAFVKEVRIIDDYTIEIETPYPEPAFLSKLGSTGCGVVSKKYVEEVGMDALANQGMGTGPFKLVEYDRESFARMVANDDYWGGRPEIDELVFRVIPEPSTRVAELLTGGADIVTGISPQDWERIEADPNLEIQHYLTDRVYQLTVANSPPEGVEGVATELLPIRAAISYAIDRQELIDLIGGHGVPTLTRLTPPLPCWDQVDPPLYDVNPYDPERAKELMEEAGYPDVPGGPLITVHGSLAGQYIGQKEIAETVAAMLDEIGFEVELKLEEGTTFLEGTYRDQNEELMLESLGNRITDPWIFILNYDSNFGERTIPRTRASVPEIDELAEKANTTMDPEERCEIVAEYAQLVAEQYIAIPLFHMPDAMGIRNTIDWTPSPDGMMLMLNARFTE